MHSLVGLGGGWGQSVTKQSKHNMASKNKNKRLRDTDQDSDTDSDNETLLSLVCVSMLQMVLVLLTSLNCYMSTLSLVHYQFQNYVIPTLSSGAAENSGK